MNCLPNRIYNIHNYELTNRGGSYNSKKERKKTIYLRDHHFSATIKPNRCESDDCEE